MKRTKVGVLRSVDILDRPVPPRVAVNLISPVTTSSIQPEFLTDHNQPNHVVSNGGSNCGNRPSEVNNNDDLTPVLTLSRDPKGINEHVKIQFYDVIGEPSGIQSTTWSWWCAVCCYTFWKNFKYKLITIVTAFPLALFYGCWFGLNSFTSIWLLNPFTYACNMCCGHCVGEIMKLWFSCAIGIPCRATGQIFWVFNKRVKQLSKQQGPRLSRVTFSNKVRTKRFPRHDEPKLTDSQMRVLFSRSPWKRRFY